MKRSIIPGQLLHSSFQPYLNSGIGHLSDLRPQTIFVIRDSLAIMLRVASLISHGLLSFKTRWRKGCDVTAKPWKSAKDSKRVRVPMQKEDAQQANLVHRTSEQTQAQPGPYSLPLREQLHPSITLYGMKDVVPSPLLSWLRSSTPFSFFGRRLQGKSQQEQPRDERKRLSIHWLQ